MRNYNTKRQSWQARILAGLCFLFLLPGIGKSQDCTQDWQYRQRIFVDYATGVDTLRDYQVRLTIDTDALITPGKMDSLGRDIRFTDGNCCTQLCFWIEDGINTSTTTIWVKIPRLIPGESHPIFMYYGNPLAPDAQDGACTFELFDTFDGVILNPTTWSTSNIIPTVGGSELRLRTPTGDGGMASTATFDTTASQSFLVTWRARSDVATLLPHFTTWGVSAAANPWNTRGGPFAWDGSPVFDSQNAAGGGCSNAGAIPEDNAYHTFSTLVGQGFATDGVPSPWCGPIQPNLRAAVATSSSGSDTYIDWVYVAKVANIMPTIVQENEYTQFQVSISVIGNDTICTGDFAMLDAGAGYTAYEWSTGDTTQMITVSMDGFYSVVAFDSGGCGDIDSLRITVVGTPVNLGPDTTACESDPITLDAGSLYDTFAWSTGETTQTITVDSTADYSVTVTEVNGCSYADTVNATFFLNPVVDLGNDTSFCENDSILVDAGPGFAQYAWSTGDTTPSIFVRGTQTVSVMVADSNSCADNDTLQVTENLNPTIALGPDQTGCDGDTILLDAGAGAMAYAWSNGDTTSSIMVMTSGNYDVVVTDTNGCNGMDTAMVTLNANPQPMVGSDTTLCLGDSVSFDAGPGYTQYSWSNGATTQMITTSIAGTYTVMVTDTNGCMGADSASLFNAPATQISLGADTTICDNTPLILTPGSGFVSYMWQDGSTTPDYTVSIAGTYAVSVMDSFSCTASDTISVATNPAPVVNLGPDRIFCQGDSVVLDAGAGASGYLWSTGDTTQAITANASLNYSVVVTSGAGCEGSDTVQVTVEPLPVSGFTFIQNGLTIDFTNASVAADSFFWDLGDGFFSIVENPSHTYTQPGTYYVCLQAENDCGTNMFCDSVQIVAAGIAGLAQDAWKIRAFPNPGGQFVTVNWEGAAQVSGQILDLQGSEVYRWKSAQGESYRKVDLSHLRNGVYFIRVQSEAGEVQHLKWVKSK